MLGQPDGFYYPQSQDKNEEGKQTRQRKKRWAEPPSPYGLEAKGQTRGRGEWILSLNLCLHVDSDEACLWGGVNGEVITFVEYGVVLRVCLLPSTEIQLKVITGAASSITSRNKHCNHALHPSTNFLGTKWKNEEDTSSLSSEDIDFLLHITFHDTIAAKSSPLKDSHRRWVFPGPSQIHGPH